MKTYTALATAACLAAPALADVYMHNPPGNNDRNRERNDNRNNGNRLFDSQNNAKGGYPWRGNPTNRASPDPLSYWAGSELELKWTQQHGAGENPTTHSQIIIQYSCDDQLVGIRDGYPTGATQTQANGNGNNDDNNESPQYLERVFNNDGQNQDGTNRIPDSEDGAGCVADEAVTSIFGVLTNRATGNCDACSRPGEDTFEACEFGMNEDYYYYQQSCDNRQRNKGLYTADRKLNRNDARATRQNPNGARSGLECPEERDYYPYWHPSPWIDAAIMTSDTSWCEYYKAESQNVKGKWMCDIDENTEAPITERDCVEDGGTWIQLPSWQDVYGEDKIKAPECVIAQMTPQNALGFTAEGTDYSTYKWTIPDMPGKTCVVRLRYNISTEDYPSMSGFVSNNAYGTNDGQKPMDDEATTDEGIFDSRFNCPYLESNDQDGNDVDAATNARTGGTGAEAFDCYMGLNTLTRPRYNRPEINPFGDEEPAISIALNTDQSGRTFQDRSFVFKISEVPSDVPKGATLLNLNVLGKRGNIVQSYPAVEYAFVPSNLTVDTNTVVNMGFHGSDFNNEKNPNNGEGWKYSDRTNMMEVVDAAHSFPGFYNLPNGDDMYDGSKPTFFSRDEAYKLAFLDQVDRLAAQGGYTCMTEDEVDDEQNDPRLCGKLNYASNTFETHVNMASKPTGTYEFISTRNNNFSNRDQKMTLTVVDSGKTFGIFNIDPQQALTGGIAAGVVIGMVALVAVIVAVVMVMKGNAGDSDAPSASRDTNRV